MAALLLLCLLFLIGGPRSLACPHPCSCQGVQVDCSGKSLTSASMPSSFPAVTTELLLHDNLLSTLPNGALDDLTELLSDYERLKDSSFRDEAVKIASL
uniref:LRRNT domain-containing protein n=1 Tax=Fundulus heteroclitus TaxID=8078 RepID=A0A3Q2TK89_FUNHE